MDPYDQSIPIEQFLGQVRQEKKRMDSVKLASVAIEDTDPMSASNVAWLIHNGYIPRISDHAHQQERFELLRTWTKGVFYPATVHWERLGLSGYNAWHD